MTPQEKAKELVDKFDGVGLQMRNEAIALSCLLPFHKDKRN